MSFVSNGMRFGGSGRLNRLSKDFEQTSDRAGMAAPCWSPRCPSCWPGPATSCLNPSFTSPFGTGIAQTRASPLQCWPQRGRSRSPSQKPEFKHPWHFLWVVPTFPGTPARLGVHKEPVVCGGEDAPVPRVPQIQQQRTNSCAGRG